MLFASMVVLLGSMSMPLGSMAVLFGLMQMLLGSASEIFGSLGMLFASMEVLLGLMLEVFWFDGEVLRSVIDVCLRGYFKKTVHFMEFNMSCHL